MGIELSTEGAGSLNSRHQRFNTSYLATGDIEFVHPTKMEQGAFGNSKPFTVIISSLGRRIIHQNPHFLRDILQRSYPQQFMYQGNGSQIYRARINLDGQDQLIAIKYHNEGRACLPHYTAYGSITEIDRDRVSGVDNFWALRAIQMFARNLLVPEPIIATEKIFVANWVEGHVMHRGLSWVDRLIIAVFTKIKLPDQEDSVPGWVKSEVGRAIKQAYRLGWLRRPSKRFGLWPRGHEINLDCAGNVLRTPKGFCVVDPIS